MQSPLGKYAPLIAAVTAIGVVSAWVVAEFIAGLGMFVTQPSGLKEVALIAVGAIFGSAVTVNGWKQPLESAHHRIDAIENATGIPTHTDNPPS